MYMYICVSAIHGACNVMRALAPCMYSANSNTYMYACD